MTSKLCIVDTNVPLIANGKSHVGFKCQETCISRLQEVVDHGHLVIDDAWRIVSEYLRQLSPSGQPGVGDAFLKWVLTHHANPDRCSQVPITAKSDDPEDFEEFPDHPDLTKFDRSDRKFVAVARAHPKHPLILQGSDSKWWGWHEALEENGVQVEFLCPEEIEGKFRQKFGKS